MIRTRIVLLAKEMAMNPRPRVRVALLMGVGIVLGVFTCTLGRFLVLLQQISQLIGSVDELVVSPDLRYAVIHQRYRTNSLWDVAAGRELRQLTGKGNAYVVPKFSQDSRRLAYLSDWHE